MITTTLIILSLLENDRKECWGPGKVGIWRLKEHTERTETNRTG